MSQFSFVGPAFRPGTYVTPVRVTDMAPTLAAALNVRPTERLDGRVLREALMATTTTAAGRSEKRNPSLRATARH
jgi:arylsulfatase A-like enzyme